MHGLIVGFDFDLMEITKPVLESWVFFWGGSEIKMIYNYFQSLVCLE